MKMSNGIWRQIVRIQRRFLWRGSKGARKIP